jgi:hypothetical protein
MVSERSERKSGVVCGRVVVRSGWRGEKRREAERSGERGG